MSFGIPYQGSKSQIANKFINIFPKAEHFYDLFGGGGAVTHAMLLNRSSDYSSFHYNEIKVEVVETFNKAIRGEFSYVNFTPRWISREEFFEKKGIDGYIKTCWSFGNDGKCYLYSKNIEPYKKSLHQAVILKEFDELSIAALGFDVWPDTYNTITKRRLYLRHNIEKHRINNTLPKILWKFLPLKARLHMEEVTQFGQLQQLQQLQRLEQLQQLVNISKLNTILTTSSLDYREIEILSNSVVYCDIPYLRVKGYCNTFNHAEFLNWAATRTFPVYVSEYNISDNRFTELWCCEKRKGMQQGGTSKTSTERIYWNGK